MKLTLRSYWRSSCSWRVRIALNWKGLNYDTVPVHLVNNGGEQHTPAHRSLNPMRELPVLLVDGEPLAQSVAILEYLEETHPEPPLLPMNQIDRARVRQMTEIINSGIQPIQNLRVMQRLGNEFGLPKEQQLTWSRGWIEFGFTALEKLVAQYGGKYSFGNHITWADVCLVPQLYNARRFQANMESFPHLVEVGARLDVIPAFAKAIPESQPDAP